MDVADIELGDVVYLESGGPAMTVGKITTNGNLVSTAWFDENYILHEATFVVESLTFDDPN